MPISSGSRSGILKAALLRRTKPFLRSWDTAAPIAAAVTNAHAALRWLGGHPPALQEVRQSLDAIIKDGNRAGDVIGRIRALIKKAPPRHDQVDINEAILEVIEVTRSELLRNGI